MPRPTWTMSAFATKVMFDAVYAHPAVYASNRYKLLAWLTWMHRTDVAAGKA